MPDQYLFDTSLKWKKGNPGMVTSPAVNEQLRVAASGSSEDECENRWSPDHLLVSALSSCIMATYLFYAKKRNLALVSFNCKAVGRVEMINRQLQFTGVHLYPEILLERDESIELAKDVFEIAVKYCLVSQVLKLPVEYNTEINIAARPATEKVI